MALFNKDYESAGVGISKHAPKKKGFALFMDLLKRKFWQLAEINFLYTLFFIPLMLIITVLRYNDRMDFIVMITLIAILILTFMITIGPATAGVYKIMRCYVIEKHSFIIRDFFRAFKTNFKKAAVIGFLDCIILLSVFSAYYVYSSLAAQTGSRLMYIPLIIVYSVAIVVLMMNFYIYLMLIATNLSLKNLIKNSFALAFVAMKSNVIIIASSLAALAVTFLIFRIFFPVFLILMWFFPMAFIFFVTTFNSYPVIQKYVINPYYEGIGEINPEIAGDDDADDEERIFEDMGGKEKPIEKRKKTKGRRIS